MSMIDILLLAILTAVLVLAVRKWIKDSRNKKLCGGDCAQCSQGCRK